MKIKTLTKRQTKLVVGLVSLSLLVFLFSKKIDQSNFNATSGNIAITAPVAATSALDVVPTVMPATKPTVSKNAPPSVFGQKKAKKQDVVSKTPIGEFLSNKGRMLTEEEIEHAEELERYSSISVPERETQLISEEDKEEDEEREHDEYDGPGEAAEFEYERTKNPTTNRIPVNGLMEAINNTVRAKSQNIAFRSAAALMWSERGPFTDAVGPSNGNTRPNNGITAGRIRAVWVDLADNTGKTVWVGGVDGGLWKTTDITASTPNWILVNDFLSNLAIGGICQDPTNFNTMYFCTGEAYSNADAVRGAGVFKSTDGGASWTQLSSTTAYTLCSRIQCDAAGNIYLGTNLLSTGLLRSNDGGSSWTTITPSDLTTRITDFEISSTGRFHVAVGYRQSGGGLRYTDNPSTVTSATWTSPTTPFTYPTGNLSRVELSCSGNTLYAVPSNASGVMSQIHKSTDGGDTWTTTTLTTTNINDLNGSTTSGQGWYCIGIDIDPTNANTAIVGGLNCLKTTDGGTTWSKISEWVGTTGQYVHADIQHVKWYDGGNKLVIACDGGIHYSSDKGTTFRDRNTNLRLKQFYSCAIHPTLTNYFLAGAQDNGTHQLNSAGISSSVEVTGGDGAYVAIDQDEPQFQFGAYVFNTLRRSTNSGTSWSAFNFGSSLGRFINPWDYDNLNNKIYASTTAGNYFRWDDPQTATSVGTSTNATIAIADFNGAQVSAITVSPFTAHQVYFGTGGTGAGRIVKVTNANTATPTSVNITGATMPVGAYMNCINTGTNDNNLIACFSSYGVNNVWITTDGGTNWTAIDGNLPDMPVRWAMFFPNDNTKAYIATETGVWETELINGASTVWTANTSFPTVRTDMLKYRSLDRTIVAGTHGRGLWSAIIPNASTITAPIVGAITHPTCVLATGSVVLSGLPASGTWTLTRSPGAVTTTGTGVSTTVTGIPSGTFTFTVTNSANETSPASANVFINAQPATPTAPSVGTITQSTCTLATGSVVLNGLPSTGTWTLTRSPGAVTTTGTGTSTTISGLSAGTYTYTVTNAAGCTSVASANVVINAQPATPTAPTLGTIIHPTCASPMSGSVVLNGLPASGTWTLTRSPGAVTTTGTGTSTTITGLGAGTYTYTVTNAAGCTSVASVNVVVNAPSGAPTAPSVGTITQPTCAVATGSVVLNGLPSTGTWTLTRSPGAVTTTGTGTSTTISGLAAGTYTYTVADITGCTSTASANVVINAQPVTPTAPSVGTITQPSCTTTTGSVVLNGLPATGTWILTRSPGAIMSTGTGSSTTISGLAPNTYSYTVTNDAGCTSVASANIVINAQPTTPTAPSVGAITQPTCPIPTGSVVLSGLPASGSWTINPGGFTGTGTSTTLTGLAPNTYNFTVTNASGCTSPSSTTVTINAATGCCTPPTITAINATPSVCTNGTITVSATGSGTLEYSKDNGSSYQTSNMFTGLTAGNYNIRVRLQASPVCVTTWANNPVVITGAANTPPTVTLTSPSNGAVVATNATLTATASDADGTISQVNFYWVVGTTKTGTISRTLLGSDNTAPYSFNWNNITGGYYDIQAEAVDNCGAKTFSNTANVNVLETFTVLITSPASGQTIVPGSNLNITGAVVAYTSRTVAKVEFYKDDVKIGEDLTAPYNFVLTNVPSGSFNLSAKAIDNTGAVWSSAYYYFLSLNVPSSPNTNNTFSPLLMNISPNPARNQAVLNTSISQEGVYSLSIMDLVGKSVFSKKANYVKGANTETLDLSTLSKGVYIVRLAQEEGIEFIVQKLIIQ